MSSLAAVRRLLLVLLAAVVTAGLLAAPAAAQGPGEEARAVEILQLSGPLTPPSVGALHRLVAEATERGAEVVVVQIDTPGAVAVDPAEVVAPIRDADVPVVVWVGPFDARAAGAGTYLLAAAHVPAVSRFADVGPPCPPRVDRGCDARERALWSELAPGVDAALLSGEATPRSGEAVAAAGLAEVVVEGLEPLLVELDGREVELADGARELRLRQEEVTVRFHSLGLLERTLHAALDPTLLYLMVLTVLFLLAFELFQPGFGVAGIAALLLLPLTAYGLVVLPVSWWAAALVVAGLALLAVDLAIAGLGVPTALGVAALGAGSWWFFPGDHPVLALSPWLVGTVVTFGALFFVVIMTVVLRAQAGPEVGEVGEELVGEVGVVRSTMNPEGHVFVAGALWRARWTGTDRGRIRTGTPVRIVGVEETTLLVDDVREGAEDPAAARGAG